jgi:hypothetical protein
MSCIERTETCRATRRRVAALMTWLESLITGRDRSAIAATRVTWP